MNLFKQKIDKLLIDLHKAIEENENDIVEMQNIAKSDPNFNINIDQIKSTNQSLKNLIHELKMLSKY